MLVLKSKHSKNVQSTFYSYLPSAFVACRCASRPSAIPPASSVVRSGLRTAQESWCTFRAVATVRFAVCARVNCFESLCAAVCAYACARRRWLSVRCGTNRRGTVVRWKMHANALRTSQCTTLSKFTPTPLGRRKFHTPKIHTHTPGVRRRPN